MIDNSTITKEDTLIDLLNDLDITKEENYNLIIWNDHVNSMDYIVVCLFQVCQLTAEESIQIMYDAHTNGKAVAKTGSKEEMLKLKQALNDKSIDATVEQC